MCSSDLLLVDGFLAAAERLSATVLQVSDFARCRVDVVLGVVGAHGYLRHSPSPTLAMCRHLAPAARWTHMYWPQHCSAVGEPTSLSMCVHR